MAEGRRRRLRDVGAGGFLAGAVVIALFSFLGAAGAAARTPVQVARSEAFTLRDPRTGRAYRIMVAAPAGRPPESGWPVVYVVDGDYLFMTAVEDMRAFERRPGGRANPRAAVIVGLGYPAGANSERERVLDLTPPGAPQAARNPDGAPVTRRHRGERGRRAEQDPLPSGGADAFLRFIETDVKPRIERRYRIDRGRQAVVGHSLGGLFVLHALFTRPDAFSVYAALSPSLWYGDRLAFSEAQRWAARPSRPPARVLLTIGEFEQTLGGIDRLGPDPEGRAARLAGRRQVDNAREMAAMLREAPGVTAHLHTIAGEDHGSSLSPAVNRAIRFALYPDLDALGF